MPIVEDLLCYGSLFVFFLFLGALILGGRSASRPRNEPQSWNEQEPRVPTGQVTGYKKLVKTRFGCYRSPSYGTDWVNGSLEADYRPSYTNRHGIYMTKTPDDPALDEYEGDLVQLRGYGKYIEHEHGYRTEGARITNVVRRAR